MLLMNKITENEHLLNSVSSGEVALTNFVRAPVTFVEGYFCKEEFDYLTVLLVCNLYDKKKGNIN